MVTKGRLSARCLGTFGNNTTTTWDLINQSNELLGSIKWKSGWRKYVVEFNSGVAFDPSCLRDLADILEDIMRHENRHVKGD